MTAQEHARELLAHKRQQDEHLQESMRTRAEEQVQNTAETHTDEQARELLAHKRQQDEHLQESMLTRAVENL